MERITNAVLQEHNGVKRESEKKVSRGRMKFSGRKKK
jgi:hypothetical protein